MTYFRATDPFPLESAAQLLPGVRLRRVHVGGSAPGGDRSCLHDPGNGRAAGLRGAPRLRDRQGERRTHLRAHRRAPGGHRDRGLARAALARAGGRRRRRESAPPGRIRARGGARVKRLKVLVAKPGLDGHDRGAKVVAQALRDAGMDVIYTGLKRTPAEVVREAIQEDVDVIGLSVLSGAHELLCRKVVAELSAAGAGDIRVAVGGTIPTPDVEKILTAGAWAVFPVGTPLPAIVSAFEQLALSLAG